MDCGCKGTKKVSGANTSSAAKSGGGKEMFSKSKLTVSTRKTKKATRVTVAKR